MDVPNIQLAKVRGQNDIRGYEFGLRNPLMPYNQTVIRLAA